MPRNPDTDRDFHDPTDVFQGFGTEGSPAVVGDPERIIFDEEDGYSVHVAACSDGTVAIANVTTACAPEACRRTYTHLDRSTLLGMLAMLPAIDEAGS